MDSDTIYDPQEDSYLLEECVKKYSKGIVLDMGCGSGIQGAAALGKKEVIGAMFADVNPKAIRYAEENLLETSKKTTFVHSDLFSKISKKQKFDTILFNPPYLPEDELDSEKLITTGGVKGYEIVERFLIQAKEHLNIDGQILVLFSSLTNKGEVDAIIRGLGFDKNLIAHKGLFMEQLYVYLLKLKDKNIIKGHRGIVEVKVVKIKGKNLKIAIKRSLTEHYDAIGEAKFLKILNKKGIGPKLLKSDSKSIRMEYVDGERILDYFENKNSTKKQIIEVISKVLDQLYIMDELKINKLEMTNPYKHIIIRIDDKSSSINPVMIDFERCIYTEKPKNVTQFIQFLASGKLNHIFKNKRIIVDIDRMFNIAKNYKREISKKYLKDILDNIK